MRWVCVIAGVVFVAVVGIVFLGLREKGRTSRPIEPVLPSVTEKKAQKTPEEVSSGWESDAELARKLATGRSRLTVGKSGGDFRTIQEAVDAIADGGTIEILDSGTYLQPPVDGRAKKNITLKPASDSLPTVTAQLAKGAKGDETTSVIRSGNGWSISGLRFTTQDSANPGVGVSAGPECEGLRVEGCRFDGLQTGILFSGFGECRVARCVFARCGSAIASCAASAQPTQFLISHCVVWKGKSLLAACRKCPYQVTVRDSAMVEMASHVYSDGANAHEPAMPAVRGDMKTDLNCYYRVAGLYRWAPMQGKPDQLAIDDIEKWREQTKNDQRSIILEPKFVDPEHGNFLPASGSPCLGRASDGWDIGLPLPPEKCTPARLHAALKATNPQYDGSGEFAFRGGKMDEVRLLFAGVRDISALDGLPLTTLILVGNPINDLNPLQGMPLDHLWVVGCGISDISPIRGMPLYDLALMKTNVKDLDVLQGMKLLYLKLSETNVNDISVLKGMELRELTISSTNVKDITVLKDMATLEVLAIPRQVEDIQFLRRLPNLKRLDTEFSFEEAGNGLYFL